MTAEENYMLALCRAGYLDETPPLPPDGFPWLDMLALAQHYKISALVAEAALRLPSLSEDVRAVALQYQAYARYIEAVQYFETNEYLARLREAGVDYCLLKGWHWRSLYPKPALRDTRDVDLLVRLEQWEAAGQAALEQGFEQTRDIDLHVAYDKGDVTLELHRSMLSSRGAHEERYRNVWNRLLKVDDHEWRVPATEDYLYFFLHTDKHVGCYDFTLRTLVDIAAFRREAEREIDRKWFWHEVGRVHLKKYVQNLEGLASTWLSGRPFSKEQEKTMDYLLSLRGLNSDEKRYRLTRRWLSINLSPLGILRTIFPPRGSLAARYEGDAAWKAVIRHLDRVLHTYHLYLRDYWRESHIVPVERQRVLNDDWAALYRRVLRTEA